MRRKKQSSEKTSFSNLFFLLLRKREFVYYTKCCRSGIVSGKAHKAKRLPASGVGWLHAEAQASSVTSYCLPALCSPGSSCLRHRAPWNRNARCRFRPPRKSPSACPLSGVSFAPPKAGGTVTIPSLN